MVDISIPTWNKGHVAVKRQSLVEDLLVAGEMEMYSKETVVQAKRSICKGESSQYERRAQHRSM